MRDGQVFAAMSLVLISSLLMPAGRGAEIPLKQETVLEIVEVRFEPLQQGKNVVHVQVRNTSDRAQMFRTHMGTRSPEYGRSGVGWGTGFFETVPAGATKWTRFAFKIQGPLTDSTYVRLTFSNPGAAESFDEEAWAKNEGWGQSFQKTTYPAPDLPWRKDDPETAEPAPSDQADAVVQVFREVQEFIRNAQYDRAWQLFTKDYQQAEFQSTDPDRFVRTMEPERMIDAAFVWEKGSFLGLKLSRVVRKAGRLSMLVDAGEQRWTIDFVQEDDGWKIDGMTGYTPRVLQWQNWEEHVLPRMTRRETAHFDIYYFPDSTAARQIDQLARDKDQGYAEICGLLGVDSDIRIRLVLFEDSRTKHWETGHQGMGWAYNTTIVEVYNETEKLDPYHEIVHILMGPRGSPPALFSEGFAVYMSEHLGANALEDLGGGAATINERVRDLKQKGDWIELDELITYAEIGSRESRPPVAYAEAASFVKFLIDEFGKDRFLLAYRRLISSSNTDVHEQNVQTLSDIYGAPLAELDQRWQEGIEHGNL